MAEDYDAEVGRQIGGSQGGRMSAAKASFKVDTTALSTLKKELSEVKEITSSLKKEMKSLADEAERYGKAMKGAGAPGGGSGTSSVFSPGDLATKNNKPVATAGAPTPPVGGGGVSKFLGGAGTFMAAAAPIVGGAVSGLDARIDRGKQYMTSMDRLNLLTQQMTGMSQMDVITQMRSPLRGYKLGEGGINSLMAFQASTGTQATPQFASSLEAMRASTGFSKTTQDLLTQQGNLMDPTVANQMLFTLGVNAYEIGGGVKDPMKLQQQLISRMGLTNPRMAEAALKPGSIARATMARAGLGEEFQTQLIQYAQQNAQFRERGGKGFYDPTKEADLRRMGIDPEKQLSIQQEETTRLSQAREEQFAERQIDNMADLERSNQKLIEALGSLEDKISGLIGERVSSRPLQRFLGTGLKALGLGLGVAAAPMTGGSSLALGLGIAGGTSFLAGSALSGDPMSDNESTSTGALTKRSSSANDANIKVPYGYNNNRISLQELKSKSNFKGMHPTMQERLLQMMRANPNVGLGQGLRETAQQERMFRERYTETSEGDHDVEWDGKFWKHVSGAPAAPPGRSMHEIGLAADLVGDLDWANAHAAEFGLKHFANVNNEPWHFQPSELPNSRKKYEDAGAAWGTDKNAGMASMHEEVVGDTSTGGGGDASRIAFVGVNGSVDGINFSLSESLAAQLSSGSTRLGSTGGTFGGKGGSAKTTMGGKSSTPAGSGAQLAAQAAYRAGFRGEALMKIVAIAGRESSWNPNAINKSSDDTGMWQIAPINWGDFTQQDLLDPYKNAQVAYRLYQSGGFSPWKAAEHRTKNDKGQWVVDPTGQGGAGWAMDGNEMWHTEKYAAQAQSAAAAYNSSGDAEFAATPSRNGSSRASSGGASSSTTHITSSPTINVAPIINFSGSPSTPDLRNIAKTVTQMLKEEVQLMELRSA